MRIYTFFVMILIVSAQSMVGCPTCIGRLELQSPAFFSDELYELKSEDDVEEMPQASTQEKKSNQNYESLDDEGDD